MFRYLGDVGAVSGVILPFLDEGAVLGLRRLRPLPAGGVYGITATVRARRWFAAIDPLAAHPPHVFCAILWSAAVEP